MADDENIKRLKQRYAKGEITEKKYLQMKSDLTENKTEIKKTSKSSTKVADNPQTKNSHHKGLWIAAIVIIVVVVALFLSASSNTNPNYYNNNGGGGSILTTQHTVTMYSQGQVLPLSPKGSSAEYYSVPSSATSILLTGSYSSSGGDVEAAVLTAQQYANFTSTSYKADALAAGYAYYGDTQGAYINTQLAPGNTYYVVFYDPGIFTSVSVNIESTVALQYTD